MRASARDSGDCGGRWPGDRTASAEDRATTTPLAMPSTIAPETRIMTPYRTVSRSRTVRRGSRERRGGRVVGTFLIASHGRRRPALLPRRSHLQDAWPDLTTK